MSTRKHWPGRAAMVRLLCCLCVGCAAFAVALASVNPRPASAAVKAPASNSDTTFSTTLYDSVSTFNPFVAYYVGETEDVLQEIYPTLTWLNQQNDPVGYLARSWKISNHNLTWTFHLQTGLKWSDGVPLTAHDVAWTYNLIMHNSTAGTANGQLVANFKSVTAPNDSTVVITTKSPQANMLSLVDTPPIVPEHIWKNHVKGLANYTNTQTPVVGYGPYVFSQYNPNQYVVLTANKHFFMGPSKYQKVILYYYSTSAGAVAALRSGQLSETDDLTAAEWKALRGAPGIKTYQTVSNGWEAVEINPGARTRSGKPIGNGNPALRNPLVRRAIATAINRQELVTKVLDGAGVPGSAYLPPAYPQWKWSPSAADAENFDLAKAGQELTAAGYPRGKNGYRYDKKTGKPLVLRLGIHSDYNSDAQIGSFMSGWMQDIGIKLEVQPMSDTQLNDNLAVGNWDMLLDQWSTSEDPTALFSIQTCGVLPTNASGSGGDTDSFFCNHNFDRLYQAEQTAFNQSQRAADVRKMEEILYNENNDVILFYNNTLSAIRTNAEKGYLYGEPNAQGYYPLQNEQIGWLKGIPPVAATSGGGSSTAIIIVVVVLVLGAGGFAIMRTRRRGVNSDDVE